MTVIVSSDARRALGLGANVRLIVIADEPGAWWPDCGAAVMGRAYHGAGEAADDGCGGRHAGARAPLTGPASWWPSFVAAGSSDGRHVSLLQADPEKWRDFDEVLRVNPVSGYQSAPTPNARTRTRGGAVERTRGPSVPSVQAQHSRRARRHATAGHGGRVGAGLCASGPGVRGSGRPSAWISGGSRESWSAACGDLAVGPCRELGA